MTITNREEYDKAAEAILNIFRNNPDLLPPLKNSLNDENITREKLAEALSPLTSKVPQGDQELFKQNFKKLIAYVSDVPSQTLVFNKPYLSSGQIPFFSDSEIEEIFAAADAFLSQKYPGLFNSGSLPESEHDLDDYIDYEDDGLAKDGTLPETEQNSTVPDDYIDSEDSGLRGDKAGLNDSPEGEVPTNDELINYVQSLKDKNIITSDCAGEYLKKLGMSEESNSLGTMSLSKMFRERGRFLQGLVETGIAPGETAMIENNLKKALKERDNPNGVLAKSYAAAIDHAKMKLAMGELWHEPSGEKKPNSADVPDSEDSSTPAAVSSSEPRSARSPSTPISKPEPGSAEGLGRLPSIEDFKCPETSERSDQVRTIQKQLYSHSTTQKEREAARTQIDFKTFETYYNKNGIDLLNSLGIKVKEVSEPFFPPSLYECVSKLNGNILPPK